MARFSGMKEIRRRLKVTRHMQQITKAMQLVAASRLRRAQPQMRHSLDYLEGLDKIMQLAAFYAAGSADPLLQPRSSGMPLIVLISGDRGLCGSYNDAVVRKALEAADAARGFVIVGLRGRDILQRHGIASEPGDFYEANDLSLLMVKQLARKLIERFRSDAGIASVRLVYTRYKSALQLVPEAEDILPISLPAPGQFGSSLEPGAGPILDRLLPALVEGRLYSAVMMSVTAEHSARRMTMNAATDNAQKMIERLTMEYNRERQDAITREIMDIVGGADIT